MSFTYFDLRTKSYKTISSKEILINVLDGPGIAANSNDSRNNDIAKNKVEVAKSFAFIKQKTNLVPIEKDDFLGSGLFYSLVFLPFLAIPFVVIARKKKEAKDSDIVGNKIRKSNTLAKKYLSEAQKHLNNKEPFYVALEKSLHNFLKAKLHIETSDMSKDKIREILGDKNADNQTVTEFISLVENCEFARYAPSTSVSIQQDYDKAIRLISDLEKQIS
jgi:hypothetical protein